MIGPGAPPRRVCALLALGFTAGCDHQLGVLDGTNLGEPQAAVFHHNPDSRLMVVLSDLPGLSMNPETRSVIREAHGAWKNK